jgi:hypothetical protein
VLLLQASSDLPCHNIIVPRFMQHVIVVFKFHVQIVYSFFSSTLMVLHIDLFRAEKGSDVNIIYESEKKRYSEKKWADEVIEFDREWRKGAIKL